MLNKSQIIERIQQINRSASHAWLDRFETSALRHYLDHLQCVIEPRGRQSIWIRRAETAASYTRRPIY